MKNGCTATCRTTLPCLVGISILYSSSLIVPTAGFLFDTMHDARTQLSKQSAGLSKAFFEWYKIRRCGSQLRLVVVG